ncbi:MAG: hypothetical protein EBV46_05245 [Burkholderiaceae bacterium]|nr:hypothetical protein [Burkholderiaceae bacterium]
MFQGVIARDLRLALRRKSDSLAVLIFFAVVASLFPLGIGPEQNLLMQIAPGMLWIAALLAAMLSLHKIFSEDFMDGSLDQIALLPKWTWGYRPLFFTWCHACHRIIFSPFCQCG